MAARKFGAPGIARLIAFALGAVMIYYFVFDDPIRADNPFLWPDAVIIALMLGTPLVRGPLGPPAMIFSFAWAAGVWSVSLFTYVVRGVFPDGSIHILLIAACVLGAAIMAVTPQRLDSRTAV